MEARTIGVVGGGQLGRMMSQACHRLGVKMACLDALGTLSPCGQIRELAVEGELADEDKIKELSVVSDVLTVEIEHVNCDALQALEDGGVEVHPNPATIKMIQDKYMQKNHFRDHGLPLGEYMEVANVETALKAGDMYGYPYMLKNRKFAYDGKGNAIVKSADGVQEAFLKLGLTGNSAGNNALYAEKMIPFAKELAVIVARTKDGIVSYPVVETKQKDNICHLVLAPAQIPARCAALAEEVAIKAVSSLSGRGVYGVELFLLQDDTVLVNEVAPRPHNSGHYTLEACDIDQFEMHVRAVLGLPCPKPVMRTPCALMINVLGHKTGGIDATRAPLLRALGVSGASVHWYGKSESRAGRKMAHLTVTGDDYDQLKARVAQIIPVEEDDHFDTMQIFAARSQRVAVIMGSDSDLSCMKDAAQILEQFGVGCDVTIVSAHRTPTKLYNFAQTAAERGVQVIIAGAGGAAHLPGMVAALTPLPVIGVPIKTSAFNGNDSLLSIVQMPRGVPVATVSIGGAANAGLLALRILGAQDPELLLKMEEYLASQEEEVLNKAVELEAIGYTEYLSNM